MRRNWSYLKYVIRHKYYIYKASKLFNLTINDKWRILVHDLSKFDPIEWIPYAKTFYAKDGTHRYKPSDNFNQAWLKHIHHNPHHWQHWVLRLDSGDTVALKMPDQYMREMVFDWAGAGKAIHGTWDLPEWYEKNKEKMVINESTRHEIEGLIKYFKFYSYEDK